MQSSRCVTKRLWVAVADDRSAALIVRVWLEDGMEQFRARVIAVGPDTPDENRTVATTSSPSEVLDAVSHWLEEFARDEADTD